MAQPQVPKKKTKQRVMPRKYQALAAIFIVAIFVMVFWARNFQGGPPVVRANLLTVRGTVVYNETGATGLQAFNNATVLVASDGAENIVKGFTTVSGDFEIIVKFPDENLTFWAGKAGFVGSQWITINPPSTTNMTIVRTLDYYNIWGYATADTVVLYKIE